MSDSAATTYRVEGKIALLTLNRPEARNALNRAMREGIKSCLEEFHRDENARVLVITGAGDIAFSSGADLKEMSSERLQYPPDDFIPKFETNKPVIAAVNGIAVGGGFLLTQQADLVIASTNASFGITEARFGRGSPWALPLSLLVSPRIAMEMMITAKPIPAERAFTLGLVNHLVAADQLLPVTMELAATIANNAPLTVSAAKQMIYLTQAAILNGLEPKVKDIWRTVYESEDAQEGPLAFSEKRPPIWKNR